jgi:serine O-acetyltransferase
MSQDAFINKLLQRSYPADGFHDKKTVIEFADGLFHFLFTPRKGEYDTAEKISNAYEGFRRTCTSLLFDVLGNKAAAQRIATLFFEALPGIYDLLLLDATAIVSFDPAAVSLEEVLMAYPGFYATAIYRIAHQLYQAEVPVLPRLLTEHAHSKTGIDIHPGAQIGSSFFIDHGTGIVIGQSAIIGSGVKLYQGVTLGALSTAKELANKKRHPTIGNNVVIYAGATILGGATEIGDNSIIGGNVWLTYSVAADSVVYHQSNILVKGKQPFPEPLNFII